MPRFAYTAVVADEGVGYGIGKAYEGTPGYEPSPVMGALHPFGSYDAAAEFADSLNALEGLDRAEAWRIVASTMFQGEDLKALLGVGYRDF